MDQKAAKVILVIDDESAHRILIRRAIKGFNPSCNISEAENLSEARKLFDSKTPCAITLDLSLGQESGFEFLRWIKEKGLATPPPIIVLTTSQLTRDMEMAYKLGANIFLTKQPDPTTNSLQIQKALRFLIP